jgi:hypothetical protein
MPDTAFRFGQNNSRYDQIIEEAGATDACFLCFEKFSADNPCWNSAGTNSAGTLHIRGICKRCDAKIDKPARPDFTFDGEVNFG